MDGRVRRPRALRFLSAAILLVAASFALLTCNSGLAVGLQQKIDSEEPSDPEPPIDPETQAPVEVDVVERDFYSLVLSWEPSNDDHLAQDRLQYLAGYSLDIEDVTGAAVESATLILDWTEGATTATMTGLTYGQTYHANVAVRDLAGHIAYYTPTPVRTREDEDPPVQGGDLAGSLETTTGFTGSARIRGQSRIYGLAVLGP